MIPANKPWLKSYPKEVPENIGYPVIPLDEILENTAKENPAKIALSCFENEISYAELNLLSTKFAAALKGLGVKKGDRVAIFLPNIPQYVIAYFGILKAGAILTAVSPMYREREVEHQLRDSETETIITLDTNFSIIENVSRRIKLDNIIVTNLKAYAKEPAETILANSSNQVYSFSELIAQNKVSYRKVTISPQEDLAALQYTGGTTGQAKGAMLTHFNLVSNAFMFASWIKGIPSQEVFLTALPLFHIYGMTTSMNVPILLASKMVLLPRFDPSQVLESIHRHKVTIFCGVPTMYSILLSHPDLERFDLTSIRVCISGASSLPPQIQNEFMKITGGFLAEGYGLTEASPVTHCNPVDRTMKTVRLGSIGLPLPDTDAKIIDIKTGKNKSKYGETGELCVKGPQIMRGYWKRPEETALVLKDGWLLTGDIARMDSEGYFYVTDRKKDLIKYKDYSVYPRELEDVIYECPAVKLCAVVGKPAQTVGEVPKAFISLKTGAKITEEEIMDFVNSKVAPYKALREVEFREELPMSSVGKVLRRVLRDEEIRKT